MNCPKCHQHVDDDLSFCTHCGEPVKSGLNIDADLVFSEK
ncbi:MAG: zinc ribbon domain-containing protein [Ruminococcus sp.]